MFILDIARKAQRARENRRYQAGCRGLSALAPQENVVPQWTLSPNAHAWAHAGSGRLHVYGNSMEAYDDAIAMGYGVIEADVMLTSDGVPVMSHRFRPNNEVVFDCEPTEKEFLSRKINDRFTPLTLRDFVNRYSDADVFFSIDPSPKTRSINNGQSVIDVLCQCATDKFLSKIIYQISGIRQLSYFAKHSVFGSLHYNLDNEIERKEDWWKIEHLIPALVAARVGSVSVVDMPIEDNDGMRSILSSFNRAGIKVSIAGINSIQRLERWKELGAFCVNTDYLTPLEIKRCFEI